MNKFAILLLCVLLIGCVPTVTPIPPVTSTPTPFVSVPVTPTPPTSPLLPQAIKSPTPTVTVVPIPPSNIPNASFEEPYNCGPAFCVADKWTGWYINPPPCQVGHAGCYIQCPLNCIVSGGNCSNDAGCSWAQPEFARNDNQHYPYRGLSGKSSQLIFGYGRMFDAGVYQRVNVEPGRWYEFSVWMQAWMCYNYDLCAGGRHSDEPTTMNLRVGLDPLGGIDPLSANIIWSPAGDSFDAWSLFTVKAQAIEPKMTMFTRAWPDWKGEHLRINNNVYLENSDLKPIEPPEPLDEFVYLPMVTK